MSTLFKIKDHFKENKLYLSRTITAVAIVFILTTLLVSRIAYLQVAQNDLYSSLALNNQVKLIPIPPTRGLIYDRNGVLLAENIPTFSLEIIPKRAGNIDALIARISKIIPISKDEINNFKKQLKYKNLYESVPLKNKLSEEQVAKFSVHKHQFAHVDIAARLTRRYPFGSDLSHVIGYTGPISEQEIKRIDANRYKGTYHIGKDGIEKKFEDRLHGKAGYEKVEIDARGRIIRVLDNVSPIPGENLYLTIDSKAQEHASSLMKDKLGALVMIDIKTGGILSMVSMPSFDPNLFVQGISQEKYQGLQNHKYRPLFNRAIQGQYPPGSTVKPIVALQALENNVVNEHTRIFDPGYYKLHDEGRLYRDWKPNGHGFINIEHALAESCTTYFYAISDKLGIEKINQVFLNFGLGEPTGINLYGESSGIAPSPTWKKENKNKAWFPGETLITGIGQGYTLATPLQIAHIAATIGLKGQRIQPTLIKAFKEYNKDIEAHPIIELNNIKFENKKVWEIVIRGMHKTISHSKGTAKRIYQPDSYKIAGKTGTAQVFSLKEDEVYEGDKLHESLRDHGWFMAFAPIENPEVAIAVLVEHGKGGPVIAKRVFDQYFNIPSRNINEPTSPADH